MDFLPRVNEEHEDNKIYFDFFSEETSIKRKYLLLVIYDISSNKIRSAFVKLLKTYGYRVQRSCFEVYILPNRYSEFVEAVRSFANSYEIESIRIYKLAGVFDVIEFGTQLEYPVDDVIII